MLNKKALKRLGKMLIENQEESRGFTEEDRKIFYKELGAINFLRKVSEGGKHYTDIYVLSKKKARSFMNRYIAGEVKKIDLDEVVIVKKSYDLDC